MRAYDAVRARSHDMHAHSSPSLPTAQPMLQRGIDLGVA
jgi:hypothetical protein